MNAGSALVSGVREMRDKLRALATLYPDRVKAALYLEAQIEMTESKRRCPVDTGVLRASGRVHEPVRSGNRVSVTLSYGTDYAVFVHENLEAHHPHGQAKFLESVINESRSSMAARIAKRLQLRGDA